MLPPLPPAGVDLSITVSVTFTINGELETFDQLAFSTSLALVAGVDVSAVSLTVEAASIIVHASIDAASSGDAVESTLTALCTDLAAASMTLGVSIEAISQPQVNVIVVESNQSVDSDGNSSTTTLIVIVVAAVVGLFVLLVVARLLRVYLRRRRSRARAKKRGDTADHAAAFEMPSAKKQSEPNLAVLQSDRLPVASASASGAVQDAEIDSPMDTDIDVVIEGVGSDLEQADDDAALPLTPYPPQPGPSLPPATAPGWKPEGPRRSLGLNQESASDVLTRLALQAPASAAPSTPPEYHSNYRSEVIPPPKYDGNEDSQASDTPHGLRWHGTPPRPGPHASDKSHKSPPSSGFRGAGSSALERARKAKRGGTATSADVSSEGSEVGTPTVPHSGEPTQGKATEKAAEAAGASPETPTHLQLGRAAPPSRRSSASRAVRRQRHDDGDNMGSTGVNTCGMGSSASMQSTVQSTVPSTVVDGGGGSCSINTDGERARGSGLFNDQIAAAVAARKLRASVSADDPNGPPSLSSTGCAASHTAALPEPTALPAPPTAPPPVTSRLARASLQRAGPAVITATGLLNDDLKTAIAARAARRESIEGASMASSSEIDAFGDSETCYCAFCGGVDLRRKGVECESCKTFYHLRCLTKKQSARFKGRSWTCDNCLAKEAAAQAEHEDDDSGMRI